jgi:hypothetical protein
MSRLFIAIFASLAAAVLGVYWSAPPILTFVAQDQLQRQDIDLTEFEIEELAPVRLKLTRLGLQTPDLKVAASGLEAYLVDDSEAYVAADTLQIELLPGESTSAPQTLEEILATVDEALLSVPKFGSVAALEYCQPGSCLNASVSWQRHGEMLDAVVFFPALETWLLLQKRATWSAAVFGRQPQAQFLGEFGIVKNATTFDINKQVRVRLNEAPPIANIEMDLSNVSLRGLTRVPVNATPDELLATLVSNNEINLVADVAYQHPQVTAAVSGPVSLNLSYSDQDVNIALLTLPPVAVTLAEGSGVVNLAGEQGCSLSLGFSGVECSLTAVNSSWDLANEFGTFAADANVTNLELDLDDLAPEAKGDLSIALFDLDAGQAVFEGDSQFALNEVALRVTTESAELIGAALVLDLTYQLDNASGQVELDWQSPTALGVISRYASSKVQLEDASKEMAEAITKSLSGEFLLTSTASFQLDDALNVSHATALQVSDLSLEYDGYVVEGGRVSLTSSGYPELGFKMDAAIAALDVGVPITNVRSNLHGQFDSHSGLFNVQAEDLQLSLLGGAVSGSNITYGSGAETGNALFTLDKIKVADLLALQEQEIESSGLLSGSVPVQFQGAKVTVTNAEIAAVAPGGFIRYRAEPSVRELAKSNPGVAVVLDAMEDFQYHTLRASVDYLPDGKMLARTSLKGANPNYQGGREVHLNLNLEENILVLLQSLRLGSDLAEKIGQKRGQL